MCTVKQDRWKQKSISSPAAPNTKKIEKDSSQNLMIKSLAFLLSSKRNRFKSFLEKRTQLELSGERGRTVTDQGQMTGEASG